MRSGDTSYNLFINMFYTLLFRVLRDLADNDCPGGKLPIHVRLWADEFYAGPKPAGFRDASGRNPKPEYVHGANPAGHRTD